MMEIYGKYTPSYMFDRILDTRLYMTENLPINIFMVVLV